MRRNLRLRGGQGRTNLHAGIARAIGPHQRRGKVGTRRRGRWCACLLPVWRNVGPGVWPGGRFGDGPGRWRVRAQRRHALRNPFGYGYLFLQDAGRGPVRHNSGHDAGRGVERSFGRNDGGRSGRDIGPLAGGGVVHRDRAFGAGSTPRRVQQGHHKAKPGKPRGQPDRRTRRRTRSRALSPMAGCMTGCMTECIIGRAVRCAGNHMVNRASRTPRDQSHGGPIGWLRGPAPFGRLRSGVSPPARSRVRWCWRRHGSCSCSAAPWT